jgi:hypothetical protein
MQGHVFVAKADVTKIACDAWLCPTDQRFSVTPGFANAVGLPGHGQLEGVTWGPSQAIPFRNDDHPLIVLGNVGKARASTPEDVGRQVKQLLPVVDAFVEVATEKCSQSSPLPLRLALPLIGTGHGGLAGAKGDVIRPLINALEQHARDRDIDIVLCTNGELAWSAVQSARRTIGWGLTDAEEDLAQTLAKEARAGRLVLFIGAGVSSDAGLPGWQQLLDTLHEPELTEVQRECLGKLDPRDRATLIQYELGNREKLLEKITRRLGKKDRFGLTHAVLASLGVEQAITTNYDTLYERACTAPGRGLAESITVLPGQVVENRPWLLKLHGSIDKPDHIVLTRYDYLDLARNHGALFGIVQALLVTKHLLFVGYSLGDEDFHQLVYEIRTAVGDWTDGRYLGTVLTIEDWPLATLWNDLLDVRRIGDSDLGSSARRLQIILDRVAHLATPHDAYLLDKSFENLLESAEKDIAASLGELQQLVHRILTDAPEQSTALAVQRMLAKFGAPEASPTV